MKRILGVTILACAVALSGCTNYRAAPGENETIGTLIGGVAGGAAGSAIGSGSGQIIAVILGTLTGGYIGNRIGNDMDEVDKVHARGAFHQATDAEIGHTVYWDNSYSGHHGAIRPIRDGMSNRGLYCREFQTTIFIDGRSEKMYGTACRQRDGTWVPI